MTKAERFDVHLVSSLPEEHARRMRMNPARTVEEALAKIDPSAAGYCMPHGARFMPVAGRAQDR